MTAVVSLVVVILLGMLITRVATVALMLTGMSLDAARFQARSALTGTGFTTAEAESVVNHPARRRIMMVLMLAGGAGAVSVIGGLVLSFAGVESAAVGARRAGVLVGALIALVWASRSEPVDRVLHRVIERGLRRWSPLDVRDYAELLRLRADWRVAQFTVDADHWMAGRPLAELRLANEGVAVLGIERQDGTWVGAPPPRSAPEPGDTVLVYGQRTVLQELRNRTRGLEGEQASRDRRE